MITYEHIIQSSYQFNHAQPYLYLTVYNSQYSKTSFIYQAINIKVYIMYIINQFHHKSSL